MGSKHPLANCEKCPLLNRPMAPTVGPKDSEVIFVSRSPGYHEAVNGAPFSGPSGQVLNYLLTQQNVDRKSIRLTNTVLCAPQDNKVPNLAIKCCRPRLLHDISTAKLVIAGGSEAVREILGMSIERARGYRHNTEEGRTIVATNNPAMVLRDDSVFPNLRKDFRRAFNPMPEPTLPTVEVIEHVEPIAEFFDTYRSFSGVVAADIESRGGLSKRANLISMQFSFDGTTAFVLGERGGAWTDKSVLRYLTDWLQGQERQFVWHNGSFDTKVLRFTYGIEARIDHDTMLMSYALDERPGTHSLEYLLMEEFGWPNYESESITDAKKTGIVGRRECDALDKQAKRDKWEPKELEAAKAYAIDKAYDEYYTYAGYDAAGTYQLHEYFMPQMAKDGFV